MPKKIGPLVTFLGVAWGPSKMPAQMSPISTFFQLSTVRHRTHYHERYT